MASALDNHDRCRKRVCLVCYKKGNRTIADRQLTFIQSNLIEGYDTDNLDFPSGICDGCHIILSKKMSNKFANLPPIESYDPQRPKLLWDSQQCNCKICNIAKSTISKKGKRGCPKNKTPEDSETPILKICGNCFAQLGKGHSNCTSRRSKVDNIEKLLINTPTTSQRAASFIIASSETPLLTTLGPKPKPVGSSSHNMKKQLFTTDDMAMIQRDLNLSNTQAETLAEDLRASSGSRKLIESGMKRKLRDKNKQLSDFFETKNCTFVTEDEKAKTRENFKQHIVVCNDLNGLIEHLIQEREIGETDMLVRIGIDGGGRFMKICLSVFELKSTENVPNRKRFGERFKDSGVKKVLIIGTVPDIQENYINVKRLWMETGIDSLTRNFTIATDLKLCNILLGLMSHSSTHPCCWCDINNKNLYQKGVPRTIKSLMDLFWDFFDARANQCDAKDYGNVIHPSVFASENTDKLTKVILFIPPPELHLLIGPVNKLYKELSKVWDGTDEWIGRLHVKREEYHGGSFNGNDSRKLLKNITILEELAPNNVQGFIDTFKAFNEVVVACYGENLSPNYKQKIGIFRKYYRKLGINVTPKVHAIFHHISEFCDLVKKGLGPWSEQTSESLHSDFNKLWKNYKVRDTDHDEYGKRLLDAVIAYNSQHL